jgi:hypothetical protein
MMFQKRVSKALREIGGYHFQLSPPLELE